MNHRQIMPTAGDSKLTPMRLNLILVALAAIATLRVVLTYPVFSLTSDEPAHVTCGLEWLEKGTYTYEPQHPPLARVMTAVLPYFAGARIVGGRDMNAEGWAILYSGGDSGDRNLALARLGILPFLWLGTWSVFRLSLRYFGGETALFAALFFTLLPPVLAHAGLATTDMALTATLGVAFYALLHWREEPTIWKSVWCGAAIAFSVLSKFSALVFLPAVALFMAAAYVVSVRPPIRGLRRRVQPYALPVVIVVFTASICIWAGYWFSFRGYPAPELFAGIQEVADHNKRGHLAYLFGAWRQFGFWYYYPVVLGVKTPLALLLLFPAGVVLCWKRRRESQGRYMQPLAFAFAILAVGAFSRINIGVRHILPVYFAICVVSAIAAQALWRSESRATRGALVALIAWMISSSAVSHPDYLAYFNELAGNAPEKIIADSDLDWGQDWKRLGQYLRTVEAKQVAVEPILVKYPQVLLGFPRLIPLQPDAPVPGWNAVSLAMLTLSPEYRRERAWALQIPPTRRIGKTLLLWYVPE